MSLFSEISVRANEVLGKAAAADQSDKAAAPRTGAHPEGAAVEAAHAATHAALTGKALTQAPRSRKSGRANDRKERLDRHDRCELEAFVQRVLNSNLPTVEKIRLILDVEIEYVQTPSTERAAFLRSMLALVQELEAGLDDSQRNYRDDRKEVVEAVRESIAPIAADEPEPPPQDPQPPQIPRGRVDTIA